MTTFAHYSFPCYKDGSSRINLNQYRIRQPLLVENDPNGNCEIYIVVDNTQGIQTIQNAIDNEYIVPLVSSTGYITEVTYEELRTKMETGELVPGSWYAITDYHVFNRTYRGAPKSDWHLSQNQRIAVFAVSNTEIDHFALDLQYKSDTLRFHAYRSVLSFDGEVFRDSSGGLIDFTYTSKNDFVLEVDSTYFPVTFPSPTEVVVGPEFRPIPKKTRIQCYDSSGSLTYLAWENPNVNFDASTYTISLSGGYTFQDSSGTYMFGWTNAYVYSPEFPTGWIYYRKDMLRGIEADFDFRNFRYRVWRCVPQNFSGPTGYYSLVQSGISGAPDYNGNQTKYEVTDTGDYREVSPILIDNAANVTIFNSSFFVMETPNVRDVSIIECSEFYIRGNLEKVTLLTSRYFVSHANNIKFSTLGTVTNTIISNVYEIKHVEVSHFQGNTICSSLSYISCNSFDHSFIDTSCNITNITSKSDFNRLRTQHNVKIENFSIYGISDFAVESGVEISNLDVQGFFRYTTVQNNIINTKIYVPTSVYADYVTISDEIIDSSLSFSQLNNTTLHRIESSTLQGQLSGESIPDDIINDTIKVSSDKVLYAVSVNIHVDTSSGPINIELPHNPFNGLSYVVIDTGANAASNNITINVSSSPHAGVINTINGGTSTVIDIDYGFLELTYSDQAGWIIVKKSTVEDVADEVTLHKEGNVFTINEIDYIIDDDLHSIDSSNTPASDPHRELVTRAYVDSVASAILQAEDITYSDLVDAINNSTLQANKYYRIVDYTHRNYQDASETTIYETVHPIIVRALNENTLYKEAIDPDYLEDVIIYDVNNSGISTTGRIIYRHDRKRNIEGDFDWRLTRYERWYALFSNWEASSNDFPFLSSSNSITGFGIDQDGTLKTLEAGDSAGLYPVIRDDANLSHVKLINSKYVVIDATAGSNIEMNNVSSVTILMQELGSILDGLKLEGCRNVFFAGGARNTSIISKSTLTNNVAFLKFCTYNRFDTVQQIVFAYTVSQCTFRGSLASSLFKSEIYSNLVDVKNNIQITCKGQFLSNTIIGDEVYLYSGYTDESDANIVKNNINVSGSLHVICDKSFSYNSITCDIFNNIRCEKFENNIVLGNFEKVRFKTVTNTTLIDSLVAGTTYYFYEDSFDIDKGVVNTTASDNDSKVLELSLTYTVDTTSGSYSLKLPDNPQQGTRITFIDSQNNCFNNPFTIKVSDSPQPGIVNTINGQNEWTIAVNYGFLQLVYDSVSGWIVATETTLKTSVDNITIEELPAQLVDEDVRTTGSDTTEWIQNSWYNVTHTWNVDNGTFNGDGFSAADDGGFIYLSLAAQDVDVWDTGRYYFWTDIQIDESNGGTAYFFYDPDPFNLGDEIYHFAVYDGTDVINGTTYYRYYIELDNSDPVQRTVSQFFVYIGDSNTEIFNVYHYEHVSQFLPPRHKIKNINYIIDDDGRSIDGSETPMSDPHSELVTRAYVENYVNTSIPQAVTDTFVVDSTIVATKQITLSNTPNTSMHYFVVLSGLVREENEEFTLSGNVITFTDSVDLYEGDRIQVKYYVLS